MHHDFLTVTRWCTNHYHDVMVEMKQHVIAKPPLITGPVPVPWPPSMR